MNQGLLSSASNEWSTPAVFFSRLDEEFKFTVDVCATPSNAKCAQFFSRNGLAQEWSGTVWMNPPYGRQITAWIRKAWQSAQEGATVVALVPARTDTRWWHRYVMRAAEIRLIRGRLQFGNGKDAPFPSAVVIFKAGEWTPRLSEMPA